MEPSMNEQQIRIKTEDSISVITFQGQSRLNLLNMELIADLKAAVVSLENDGRTRVVIITPKAGNVFSGGVDLKMMKEFSPTQAEYFIRSLHALMKSIMESKLPIIASVAGACLGGAMELAMACDFVIAEEEAIFGLPEIKVGIPSVIEASLLERVVGLGRSKELILLGETFSAGDALKMGMINIVAQPEDMEKETLALALKLAALSPRILGIQKDIINKWLNLGHDLGAEYSARAFAVSFAENDPREGMEAFLEKRRPDYN